MAGGWNPAIHLYSHSGGKARWDDELVCFKPGPAMPQQASVGACNATWGLGSSLDEGSLAGAAAATQAGFAARAEAYAVDEHAIEATGMFWIAETGEPLSRRAEGVCRLPERRVGERHRTGDPRGFRVDRAHQALHRDGIRHRPGQAGQYQRHGAGRACAGQADRQGRHHHVPAQLPADLVRRLRRPGARRVVRPGAQDQSARCACRRRLPVRGRRPVETPLVFPQGRRRPAPGRQPRGAGGAQQRRHPGRARRWARSTSRVRTRPSC